VVPHVRTKLFGSDCVQPKCCSSRLSNTRQATWHNPDDASSTAAAKAERLDRSYQHWFLIDVLAIARVERCFCLIRAGSPAPPKAVTPQAEQHFLSRREAQLLLLLSPSTHHIHIKMSSNEQT
jgi:hypothetical protein